MSNPNQSAGPEKITAGSGQVSGDPAPNPPAPPADGQSDAGSQKAKDARTPPRRRPLGRRASKLQYPPRPGFVRRWINEWPGRIKNALDGGWAHVKENGKPVVRVVGTAEGGGALHGYLMEIPQEFYDEDALAKLENLNEIDQQIYGGTFKANPDDMRYVPEGGIKMRDIRGRGA